ncbi:MAG TPA: chloride channel protein [Leucothrix sp.]|nr:chloride channel protein [Leucothrix sp.]
MEALRFHLARPDALLQLALLGLIAGFLAGGVIVLFHLLVESTQDYLLPGNNPDNYEALSTGLRFIFPIIASILLALMFYKGAKGIRVLGIARVMERMEYHQGYLSVREFFLQFFGSAIAIIGGHSVGREGPHVHLGATSGSLFGQLLKLPNNSIRTLVASGAAAGIAASFNTPLAGVIFALEVIMMEYTLGSFVPVMLASVSANALSVAVLGNQPAFIIPDLEFSSFSELPVLLVLGLVVGAGAALFNQTLGYISSKTQGIEIWWRVMLAGVAVALIGLVFPEVLGIGYDTVNKTLLGDFSLIVLLGLTLAKLIATSLSIGLGVPGGMIGPAFFIGATLGGVVGYLASYFFGFDPSHIGFYALLGMGAMMGASLQAPLAALTAIMELTYNPGIIMPGMLTIVIAQLTASEVFGKQSLFINMLRSNGLDYSTSPVTQVLRGIGVASVLNAKTVRLSQTLSVEKAHQLLSTQSKDIDWLILNDNDDEPRMLMPVSELAKYLQSDEMLESFEDIEEGEVAKLDLLEIPANRLQLSPISLQSNLQQAHDKFEQGAEALYVVFNEREDNSWIYGIVTEDTVEAAYKPKKYTL